MCIWNRDNTPPNHVDRDKVGRLISNHFYNTEDGCHRATNTNSFEPLRCHRLIVHWMICHRKQDKQQSCPSQTHDQQNQTQHQTVVRGASSSHLIQRYIHHRALLTNRWLLRKQEITYRSCMTSHDVSQRLIRAGLCSIAKIHCEEKLQGATKKSKKREHSSWEQQFGTRGPKLFLSKCLEQVLKFALTVLKYTQCKCAIAALHLKKQQALHAFVQFWRILEFNLHLH